jgi:hypothetical protein
MAEGRGIPQEVWDALNPGHTAFLKDGRFTLERALKEELANAQNALNGNLEMKKMGIEIDQSKIDKITERIANINRLIALYVI